MKTAEEFLRETYQLNAGNREALNIIKYNPQILMKDYAEYYYKQMLSDKTEELGKTTRQLYEMYY